MLFLLDLPKGDDVTILAQKKKDGEVSFHCLYSISCDQMRNHILELLMI